MKLVKRYAYINMLQIDDNIFILLPIVEGEGYYIRIGGKSVTLYGHSIFSALDELKQYI